MIRALKTMMVWLLLAVLPLQAVAAGRLSCGQPVQQSSQDAQHAGAAHHEAMPGAHAHHGSAHASPDDASAPDQDAVNKPHSTCSACSAFCLGALAPPSTQLSVPALAGSDAVVVAPAAFAVGFIQDGPQRPPRQQSV